MVSAGQNSDFVFRNLIDETVFLVDPARPAAGKLMLQGFGLARAAKRFPGDLPKFWGHHTYWLQEVFRRSYQRPNNESSLT